MKIYQFNQNNSGGSFDVDDKLCHRLFIESDDLDKAISIAENLGVYFDGCENGVDCECCGDRWYRPWNDDGITFPYSYGAFTEASAKEIAKVYNAKVEVKEDEKYRNRNSFVSFEDVESYAQYMADQHGWTTPDIRIFYKNGNVVEISKNKESKWYV